MPAPLEMTPEHWQHVLAVYAKHEGHQHAVAEELGWGRERVQRVWNRGYPSLGLPPVQQVLARDTTAAAEIRAERERILRDTEVQERAEQLMAAATQKAPLSDDEQRRIAVMLERENERARARADAVEARGEEAALISASRRNAIALNAVTAQVLRGLAGQLILSDVSRTGQTRAQGGLSRTSTPETLPRSSTESAPVANRCRRYQRWHFQCTFRLAAYAYISKAG